MTTTPPAPPQDTVAELRVAARTPVGDLAAAVSHALYDGRKVVLRAIGAGAINQAVKAIIQAQAYVAQRGLTLATRPGFVNVELEGQERTAIVFHVFTI